jgi:ATP phosphoribosyltransferase
MLRLALPKGRIMEESLPLLKNIGIMPEEEFFAKSTRKLEFNTNLPELKIIVVRAFDVCKFVENNAADIAICGLDVLEEFNDTLNICKLKNLDIGHCRLSFAKKNGHNPQGSILNIATKYPNIVSKYLENTGFEANIIKLNGAIECAASLGLCDMICDLVSSGRTLKENNMTEKLSILNVTSYLVASKTSLRIKNNVINDFISKFNYAS